MMLDEKTFQKMQKKELANFIKGITPKIVSRRILNKHETEYINYNMTGFKHTFEIKNTFDDELLKNTRRKTLLKINIRFAAVGCSLKWKKIFIFNNKKVQNFKNIEDAKRKDVVKSMQKLSNFYNARNTMYTQKFKHNDAYLAEELRNKAKLEEFDEEYKRYCSNPYK